MAREFKINFVSDFVCPWCVIGYYRLKKALEITELTDSASIEFHPFQLNPTMSPEGENLREHLMRKIGISQGESENARTMIRNLGEAVGFPFQFYEGSRIYNTFAAHQLSEWSKHDGKQLEVQEALYHAHFHQGRNISDLEELAAIASSSGLDRDEVLYVLKEGALSDKVKTEEKFWRSQGLRGVPTILIDQEFLITGAPEMDVFIQQLKKTRLGAAATGE
ncbi:MAG: DsbA family oxidoreductase [Polyangiaceae bacterium]|nr:DsbA family oxidoreductase [Polyangiaceae bacterium]